MFWYYAFVFLQWYSVCVFGFTTSVKPCKHEDIKCLTKLGQDIFNIALSGDPELGIESLDPMHEERVEANLATVKFNLTDSTIVGMKQCKVTEVKIPSNTSMVISLVFPRYEVRGHYEVDGKFLTMPIRGKGDYYINATDIAVEIDVKRETFEKNGKKYMRSKGFTSKVSLLGTLDVDMQNLFDGNKELADPILKFMRENAKVAVGLWGEPINATHMKKIINNCDKLLEHIPLDDLEV